MKEIKNLKLIREKIKHFKAMENKILKEDLDKDFGKIQDIDFDKKILTVESGDKTIKVDLNKYNSIDYGYALTNYKAQGATKQETLYSVGRDLREDSFYVLSTRATDNTNIYGTQEEIKGFKENINDFKQGEDIMQSFNNTQNITESITPPAQEYKISL